MSEKNLNPFRKVFVLGDTFHYLGIFIVVVDFLDKDLKPWTYDGGTPKNVLLCEYVCNGEIKEKSFYEGHLPALLKAKIGFAAHRLVVPTHPADFGPG